MMLEDIDLKNRRSVKNYECVVDIEIHQDDYQSFNYDVGRIKNRMIIVLKGYLQKLNPEFHSPTNYIQEIQKYPIFVKFTVNPMK